MAGIVHSEAALSVLIALSSFYLGIEPILPHYGRVCIRYTKEALSFKTGDPRENRTLVFSVTRKCNKPLYDRAKKPLGLSIVKRLKWGGDVSFPLNGQDRKSCTFTATFQTSYAPVKHHVLINLFLYSSTFFSTNFLYLLCIY